MRGAVSAGRAHTNRWAYAAIVVQTIVAASTYLIAKVGLEEVDAWSLLALRLVAAAPLLALLLHLYGARIARGDHARFLLLGVLGVPLNQGLFLAGLEHTTPTRTALLFALTPLAVALLAHHLLGERMTRRRSLGIAVALSGVTVVLAERGLDAGVGGLRGELTLLGAVVFWAAYSVLGKRLAARYGPLTVMAVSLLYGTLVMSPLVVWTFASLDLTRLSASFWGVVAYLAIVTTVVAYLLWYFALARLPAARVAVFSNLQPVLTGVFSIAALGESLTAGLAVGGALVLLGVVVVQRG